jgi:hypothetical protein
MKGIMLYAPPIDHLPALHDVGVTLAASKARAAEEDRCVEDDRFDVTRPLIPSPLRIGETVYCLRSQLQGIFYPSRDDGDGEFLVLELFPRFVGRGRNLNDALLDWRNQVHCRFQELIAKRPFEMTESEKADWQLLESQIDVAAYRRTTLLTLHQVGKVAARVRPIPEWIEWEDGQNEQVLLDQMPGEFAAYKPGQPFQAIVVRDPVDFRLLKVTHIRRIRSLPWMSPEEFQDLIRSIPKTSSLPETDWD